MKIHRNGPRSPISNQAGDTLYSLLHAIHLRASALPDLTPIAKVFAIVPQKAVTTLPQARPRPAHDFRTVCEILRAPTCPARPLADEVRQRNLFHKPTQGANPTPIVDDPTAADVD